MAFSAISRSSLNVYRCVDSVMDLSLDADHRPSMEDGRRVVQTVTRSLGETNNRRDQVVGQRPQQRFEFCDGNRPATGIGRIVGESSEHGFGTAPNADAFMRAARDLWAEQIERLGRRRVCQRTLVRRNAQLVPYHGSSCDVRTILNVDGITPTILVHP